MSDESAQKLLADALRATAESVQIMSLEFAYRAHITLLLRQGVSLDSLRRGFYEIATEVDGAMGYRTMLACMTYARREAARMAQEDDGCVH